MKDFSNIFEESVNRSVGERLLLLTQVVFFQELFSACNPIITKPKPKVELPKDEAAMEQNGPVNGQEQGQTEATGEGATESADAEPASETTETKPDMDLD